MSGHHRGNFSVTTGRDGSRSVYDDKSRPFYKRSKWHGRGGRRNRKGGAGGANPRSHLDDEDDFQMGDDLPGVSNQRHVPYRKNHRKRPQNKILEMDKVQNSGRLKRLGLPVHSKHSDNNWYRVKIPCRQKLERNFIIREIESYINMPFQVSFFKNERGSCCFYVQDKVTADAIRQVDKKIMMPDGFKLAVIVKPSCAPGLTLDDRTLDKLKLCLSERYDSSIKMLRLNSLYQDEMLKGTDSFMALNRPQVMTNVVTIIKENIPELVSLDISCNKLVTLEYLSPLVSYTPHLKNLNLGKNTLKSIEELEKIKDWKLDELILEGNELCNRFKDHSVYVRTVRKKFPKVLKLDCQDLPPPIVFDLESDIDLPPSKDNYFMNADVQNLLVKFLKQYYLIYDSDNRQALVDAYHDQAIFSFACIFNRALGKQPSLNEYISESRNLLKLNAGRRDKHLKVGRVNVVSQLRLLPGTQHDLNSFHIDVQHLSRTLLIFSVFGIFKETESKGEPPIRTFSRMFITTPQQDGIVIVNDMLTISNATSEQIQSAFKTPAPTPSSSPTQGGSALVETVNTPPAPLTLPNATAACNVSLTEIQKEMVSQFSVQSEMNAEYSLQCLQQNNWEYEKAAQVFLNLKTNGKIPLEAFIK
ncbi:nuclear RNA export factor 1 [Octopus sinensis]|uniref:Nuclear RNA export factor 1 n=1 Tax=Octopus sinensis TaxID=2607531 RepID=A0A6P7S8Q6_9MOLL|nr:nuclear RNA export factor 1 [Octopus sinensis]